MIFCVDTGNTNTVIGIFKDNKLLFRWRIATNRYLTQDDLTSTIFSLMQIAKIKSKEIKKVVVSSVVPVWNYAWEKFSMDFFSQKPEFVSNKSNLGIKILSINPENIGADRLVNAVAGIEEYKNGVIVVDSGTAITVDIISPNREYLGGAIMPGVMISLEALSGKTSKLQRFELLEVKNAIGKTTVEALQSGFLYGFAGMIDRVVQETLKEIDFKPTIISTGGIAGKFCVVSKTIQKYDKDLTLKGLNIIGNLL